MASSHDFFVLRRYSKESARCLLRLQNEIAKVSKDIDKLDDFSQDQPPGLGACDSFDQDPFPKRIQMIEYMEVLLQRYCESPCSQLERVTADKVHKDNSVNAFSQVRKYPTAQDRHVSNLRNWFKNNREAIVPAEQHFLTPGKERDLFPVVLKEKSPLRRVLGRWNWLRYLFVPRSKVGQVDSPATHYTSETALDRFTNTVILAAGLCLLFGPMWWLHWVSKDIYRLGIITGFVTAFTSLASSAAGQRPFEILAATAAYAAVLMVYLQISDDSER